MPYRDACRSLVDWPVGQLGSGSMFPLVMVPLKNTNPALDQCLVRITFTATGRARHIAVTSG